MKKRVKKAFSDKQIARRIARLGADIRKDAGKAEVFLLGVLQGIAAFTVVAGSNLGRWFGIVAAGLNAIGQLMFVSAYPFWALAMFAVDVLIIYGLAVYGSIARS